MKLNIYKADFLNHLKKRLLKKRPEGLYNPIYYILNLEGKRIRPILTLMSCDLFGGKITNALDAALAVEMFHNFSLIHDDIMDDAPLRRGAITVHEKWSLNTGILSGDALLVWAKQLLESYDGEQYKSLNTLFTKTALEVCEGQQYDFDFETTFDVNVEQYINMITLKTAVLVAASLKFGAIIASASQKDSEHIYNYGLNLGIAFQLQDDYLDVFGGDNFGKQKAGDIIENKKTFLFLKTLELANEKDSEKLIELYKTKVFSEEKVNEVTLLFEEYKTPQLIEEEIRRYTLKATLHIDNLSIEKNKKELLKDFAKQLMNREI